MVNGQLHAPATLPPGKSPPVPIEYEAGWASESVWTQWRRERSSHAANQTRAVHPVTRRYIDWAVRADYIQWVSGALSPGVKRLGREADHSPPGSAEVKKMWIYTFTLPYAFMA
jgi:hypothetical protein